MNVNEGLKDKQNALKCSQASFFKCRFKEAARVTDCSLQKLFTALNELLPRKPDFYLRFKSEHCCAQSPEEVYVPLQNAKPADITIPIILPTQN